MRATALFLMLAVLPALASEPGQPLDSSDWVVVKEGVVVESFLPKADQYPCGLNEAAPADLRCFWMADAVMDASGSVFFIKQYPIPGCYFGCERKELWLTRRDGQSEMVAYIDDRGGNGAAEFYDRLTGGGQIAVDSVHGEILYRVNPNCGNSQVCYYSPGYEVLRFRGLTPLLEIFQTYTPTPNTLSFRVPAIPEGLPAADYFDTYYGDLATVGDWSQAEPLQCGYPASPPSVGEYLEVADPLPNPDPGHGRYYVTAVHHQGQTRYGRKSVGGVLSGRDPAVLPACGGSSRASGGQAE